MRIFAVLVLMIGLSACQPQQPTFVLPTEFNLDAQSTAAAVGFITQTAVAQTLMPATLPPTWTPSPEPLITPTIAATVDESATGIDAPGMIYYIYNGDSIARVPADGSSEPELILLASGIEDLTLSPDGTLLAYVAQGSGSAREVFIASLDGTYNQQISCLGLPRVLEPTWSLDNAALAFIASQTVDGPLDIFMANVIGSNTCPTGNNQRQLTQIGSSRLDGMTWSENGQRIYFSDYNIKAVDIATTYVFDATLATGFGADRMPILNPRDDLLYFLRPREIGVEGGQLFVQDVSELTAGLEPPQPGGLLGVYTTDMTLNRTGEDLLMTSSDGAVFIMRITTGSPIPIAESLVALPPQPVFSPDSQYIAFIGLAAVAPQIYVIPRIGGDATVITQHSEGTVQDIQWAEN